MNIIFFGSSQFAVPTLEAIIKSGHEVACVVTQPDRKKGRGLHLETTAVKSVAQAFGLKIYQPESINTEGAIKFLKELNPDLFVVVSYGQILSKNILDVPRMFAINAHASLLPKYRGAAPMNWAIIKGEVNTGVTVIKMAEKMDAGRIISQKAIDILDGDDAITLEDKLSDIAAKLIIQTLESIKNNDYRFIPQDESEVNFAPKLKKEDGLINWDKPARDIFNLIRGCLPWPGAFTYYKGKLLKIYKARVSSQVLEFASSNPGEILETSKEGIVVFTGKGNIIIVELQIEGKRRIKVEEFIAGHKILPGEILRTKK
jgi:methionyl-tRNA formyltransferase